MEKDEFAIMHTIEQTHWWFAGKRFLIQEMLRRFLHTGGPRKTILDVGCGTGMVLDMLAPLGEIYGIDASPEAMVLSRKRDLPHLVCSDANVVFPFKDNKFDVIMCLDVLEHLDKDRQAIREIHRICSPGGLVMITVPAFQIQWSPHDVALQHRRRYRKRQLYRIASGLSWKVLKTTYYNTILFFPILAVRKMRALTAQNHRKSVSDLDMPVPSFLNRTLAFILKKEIAWLKKGNLPFGVSLLMVLQKSYGQS